MAYERIVRRIAFIEHNLDLFNKWKPENFEDFEKNLQLQAAISHKMQIIIEAIIQVCVQLVKLKNLGIPKSEDSIFELLKPVLEHHQEIIELKILRNFIVHQYIDVDTQKMYQFLNSFSHDVEHITKEFKTIIIQEDST